MKQRQGVPFPSPGHCPQCGGVLPPPGPVPADVVEDPKHGGVVNVYRAQCPRCRTPLVRRARVRLRDARWEVDAA